MATLHSFAGTKPEWTLAGHNRSCDDPVWVHAQQVGICLSDQQAKALDAIPAFIAQAMADWHIPGLAIAVVWGDEPSLLHGFGWRDKEAGLPATTDTLFPICSLTKSFTASGLAILADAGRLDWDRPVRDYVPELRLHDRGATERVTVRDLLLHRTGLPRHDWVHMGGTRT